MDNRKFLQTQLFELEMLNILQLDVGKYHFMLINPLSNFLCCVFWTVSSQNLTREKKVQLRCLQFVRMQHSVSPYSGKRKNCSGSCE